PFFTSLFFIPYDASNFSRIRLAIKLKLSKAYQRNTEKKYDVGRLADPKRKTEYSTKLRKSLQKLEQDESDIQRRWSEIREAYCKTAEEVLGFIKHHRKRWISDETWALIAERGEIKAKMLQAKSNT
ncbi:craniofacial development 2-like, partial [Brachionus plicatilis]